MYVYFSEVAFLCVSKPLSMLFNHPTFAWVISSYLQDSSSPWNLPCTTLPPKLALTLSPLYFLSISELSVGIGELSWGFMRRRLPASQRSSYCFSFPGMVAEEPSLSFLWKSTVSPRGQPLPRASPDSVEVSGKWFGERVGRIYICILN